MERYMIWWLIRTFLRLVLLVFYVIIVVLMGIVFDVTHFKFLDFLLNKRHWAALLREDDYVRWLL
jgi:hypothetical protein